MQIPEIKPLDLATVIRQAILHGRGYDVSPKAAVEKLSGEDHAAIMSFDPEGMAQFDRLQELITWARQNREKPEPKRRDLADLIEEMSDALSRYKGALICHVKSGALYRIVGAHFRESDMAICLEYHSGAAGSVKFARSIEEMDFGNRFVSFGGALNEESK